MFQTSTKLSKQLKRKECLNAGLNFLARSVEGKRVCVCHLYTQRQGLEWSTLNCSPVHPWGSGSGVGQVTLTFLFSHCCPIFFLGGSTMSLCSFWNKNKVLSKKKPQHRLLKHPTPPSFCGTMGSETQCLFSCSENSWDILTSSCDLEPRPQTSCD